MNKQTTALPKSILYNENLKPTDIILYTHLTKELVLKYKSKNKFKISPTELSKKLNISINTIKSSIKFLEEKNLLNLEENKLYFISKQFNSTESFNDYQNLFTNSYLVKEELGGYVEVSDTILYSNELTAAEKTAWIKIKSVKLNHLHINGIATITNTPLRTFKKQIATLKEKGYINYSVKRNGKKVNDTEIINLQLNEVPVIETSSNKLINIEMEEIMNEIQLTEMIELMEKDLSETAEVTIKDNNDFQSALRKQIEAEKAETRRKFIEEYNKSTEEPTVEILSELAAMC